METAPLVELFDTNSLVDDLVALGAGVSLGLLDLSDERAAIVHRLNDAGVPVTAWILLPMEHGYWCHAGNAGETLQFYNQFMEWTRRHDLKWNGVALDVEIEIELLRQLMTHTWRATPAVLRRALDIVHPDQAREEYRKLVETIRSDGHHVDVYHFPTIADERRSGARLIQRLLGVVDIPADREIWMIYTSIYGELGLGMLMSYGPEADSIAVGVTGGGVHLGPPTPTCTWEELSRDLRLARRWTEDVTVFSLEGCVEQGWMQKLRELDWSEPVEIPSHPERRVRRLRRAIRGAMWSVANPVVPLAVIGGAWWLWKRGRRS